LQLFNIFAKDAFPFAFIIQCNIGWFLQQKGANLGNKKDQQQLKQIEEEYYLVIPN